MSSVDCLIKYGLLGLGIGSSVIVKMEWKFKSRIYSFLDRINNGVQYVSVLKRKVVNLQKRMVVPHRPVSAAAVSIEYETHKSNNSLMIVWVL